jgi:hypothetical protein
LGKMDFADLTPTAHYGWRDKGLDPEGFPRYNLVETVYPVAIQEAHRKSSFSAELQLAA